MLSLIKHTREGTFELWDEHFKTILLILLETLGDNNGHVRALALRVLKEILRHQPTRFKDYAELTILRILEAHKDPVKEVSQTKLPVFQCLHICKGISCFAGSFFFFS